MSGPYISYKVCVFCGIKRKMAREHVLPKKLQERFPQRGIRYSELWITAFGFDEKQGDDHQRIAIDGRVKGVCSICNNGWLQSVIEERAEETLYRLVDGEAFTINRDRARRFATWAAKTAAVRQLISTKIRSPAFKFRWIHANQFRPPPNTRIWIAYKEAYEAYYSRCTPGYLGVGGGFATRQVRLTTIHVGHLVFVALDESELDHRYLLDEDHLVRASFGALKRIWPPSGAVEWPTSPAIAKENMELVAATLFDVGRGHMWPPRSGVPRRPIARAKYLRGPF